MPLSMRGNAVVRAMKIARKGASGSLEYEEARKLVDGL
jgi:hypothetical protein